MSIHIPLFGISIGSHSHYWKGENTCNSRPKIVLNPNIEALQICLNDNKNNYVSTYVDIDNILRLVLPEHMELFPQKIPLNQHINVIFLMLKNDFLQILII
eukprot:145550_1